MLNLYLETSVFGFYYDELEVNRTKKEATRFLFKEIKQGLFDAFISRLTLMEIQRCEDKILKNKLLRLINEYYIDQIDLAQDKETELIQIADCLIKRRVIPISKRNDAFHLAFVTLNPQIDILVTWNCVHLANVNIFRRAKAVILELGYNIKFEIATPEEVIIYG